MSVLAILAFGVRPLADGVINLVLLTASENWSQVVPAPIFRMHNTGEREYCRRYVQTRRGNMWNSANNSDC